MKNTCWVKIESEPRHPGPQLLCTGTVIFPAAKSAHHRQKNAGDFFPSACSSAVRPRRRSLPAHAVPRPTRRASARIQPSAGSKAQHLPPHPPLARRGERGQPLFREPPPRLLEVAAPPPQPPRLPPSGGSVSLCKRERGAGTLSEFAWQEGGKRGRGGAPGITRQPGREGGHGRCPTLKGKKLRRPIIYSQRLPEGTVGLCRTPLAGSARSAIPCCRATRCLPACVRSCAMCMKSGSPTRAHAARLSHPAGPCHPIPWRKKKLSALPGMKSRAVVAVKTIQQAGWYILELR